MFIFGQVNPDLSGLYINNNLVLATHIGVSLVAFAGDMVCPEATPVRYLNTTLTLKDDILH